MTLVDRDLSDDGQKEAIDTSGLEVEEETLVTRDGDLLEAHRKIFVETSPDETAYITALARYRLIRT
ncbi:hypothetical protein [Oceanibium sediminis]|uniref:hypothetical protein n=1 Tax=Oceanibium sediminis TaxID=2026339 RepID=UPI0018E5884E|nr:hypothetical protein [Oceanibium sediminis]